jgi:RNA polymerase sigma-70 factor (ECF subfamily)
MRVAVQLVDATASGPEWTVTVASSNRSEDNLQALIGLDDAALVNACAAGRRDAFDVLVERHRRSVYQLCFRFVGRHEDAADLAQDVFLRAYRAIGKFRGHSSFSTWLYRIGVNVCLNRVAVKVPVMTPIDDQNQLASPAADPAGRLIQADRAARVRAAVARLPEKQRVTVILRIFQDLSHREIADVMGSTVGAVKANFFHGLGSLRKMLRDAT